MSNGSPTAGPAPIPAATTTANGPVRVGDELRARREALGWDLGEIATALRIRLPYLEALERGDLRGMPGNAYALGFLRSYATILGLDPEPVCRRFRSETRDINRRTELSFPAPAPERGVPAGAAALVGLVVIGMVYAGWYHFSSHGSVPAQSVPELPAPAVIDGAPPPESAQRPSQAVASVMPDGQAARPPSVLTPPALPQALPPAASPRVAPPSAVPTTTTTPTTAPTTAPNTGPATTSATPLPPTAAPPPVAPTPVPPAQVDATQVALSASASSWVQVRRDGHVLYDHTMQPGDRWVLPPGDGPATMTIGNAGGISVSTGGVAGQPLGRQGAVLRNVPLGPATATQAPTNTPIPTPAPATPQSLGLSGDFSGAGRTAAHPHRAAAPPDAGHEMTTDELNARQLQQPAAPRPATH